MEARESLLALFYERASYGLSTGKMLKGVWLARGRFIGCEGQFVHTTESKTVMSRSSFYLFAGESKKGEN